MTRAAKPIVLDHRVDLYIPSQCVCTGGLPEKLRAGVIEEVKSKFDSWFGGHAEIQIKGDWRLPDGTIAKEDVSDIYSFCVGDALEQHHEDVDQLAVDIANRLTQDRVLRVFDNLKVALWPNTLENLRAKKNCACHGGSTAGTGAAAQPLKIGKGDRLSKMLVIQGILRSFKTVEHARKLFCDVLNYQYASGELPCTKWPDSIRSLLDGAPSLLADHNGLKVVYLRLSADELRRSAERLVIQRICKDDPTFRGLVVVSDQPQQNWEFVNAKVRSDDSKRLILRRLRVGVEAVRTATERLATLEIAEAEESAVTADELESRLDKAFDVEAVTKAFFTEVANWYFWALKHVHFPKDAPKETDGRDHVSVIRLITRLIFCWFLKEKNLVPTDLCDERKLADLLVGFAPGKVSNKDSVFYKAILQNLFFATLNMEMGRREWRRDGQNFMAHSVYRHKRLFAKPDEALGLFKNIPFLNGGLFECLDKILGDKTRPRYERIDGFSDREDSQPTVPDFLFFGEERELDLSKDYGDNKFRQVKVRGLIHTLNHYHFTIEESTPLEEEVALDPELAGKIFENLLAAYNPETGATARKQTGSFYTPREIVNYMVDEALIAYLKGKLEETCPKATDVDQRLRHLFSYEDEGHRFTANEVEGLVAAIDQLKALDPAVGSGAFPMGILHKLVFILGRLDPRNEMWKERQKQRLRDAIATAERIQDATIRENTLQELEQQLDGIDEAFEKNALDYGRKLYLIENCLYGVDIQPIAVQIAKMRFFISLIADQRVDPAADNLGVRPLPNLETKLVAANTLIGIEKPKQLVLRNQRIDALEAELLRVRERHFLARTPTAKAKCRERDQKLRVEIAELLKRDGWTDKTAKQLAGWDPYDQNIFSGFFDSEWMFGVVDGFDVVVSNPPYGRILASNEVAIIGDRCPAFLSTKDAYVAFTLVGLLLTKDEGCLSYIEPAAWLGGPNYVAFRTHLLSKSLSQIILLPFDMFEAAYVDTLILLVLNKSHQDNVPIRTYSYPKRLRVREFNPGPWDMIAPAEWRELPDKKFILSRDVMMVSTRLREQCGRTLGDVVEMKRGVLFDRKLLTSTKKNSNSHPYFEGDVYRYEMNYCAPSWVEYGSKMKEYPKEFKWFEGSRILLRRLVSRKRRLMATHAKKTFVTNKNIYSVLLKSKDLPIETILAIFNSSLVSRLYIGAVSQAAKDDFPQVTIADVLSLPFPTRVTKFESETLVSLVTSILAKKAVDPNAELSAEEQEIDEIVYRLYGLTREEIMIVEEGR